MNVVTAAPAATPRTRGTSPEFPAAGDDFAALLAGLAAEQPTCAALLDEPVDAAPTDSPLPDEAAEGQTELPAKALATPPAAPVPVASPVAEGGAVHTALPAAAAQARSAALPPSAPTGPPPAGAGHPDALAPTAVAAAAAPAVSGTPDVRPAASPAGTAHVAAPAGCPRTAGGTAELSIPADVAGDSPVPALDARATASPAAPAAGAQTAGPAVADAVLATDAAAATTAVPASVPAATPVDAPRPEAAPAMPLAAPAGVGAEAGVAGPQPADPRPSAPAVPAATAPPPPPGAQVVQLLSPVLAGPDGSYSLSLQLYPEELGAVHVEVLLRGSEIRLALHAPDEVAQAALRSALPDLRADLQAGGLSATSLTVDDGRLGQSSLDRSADRSPDGRPDGQGDSPGRRPHPYRGAEPDSRPPTPHSDAGLDLRM